MTRAVVDWTPLVPSGEDPVPGDPDAVTALGTHYSRVAVAIEQSAAKLRDIAGRAEMRSEAVDAVREQAQEAADHVARAHERYVVAGRALLAYAPVLEQAQQDARTALAEAQDAAGDATAAAGALDTSTRHLSALPPGADRSVLETSQAHARGAADAADQRLAAAHERLSRALADRNDAADAAAAALVAVGGAGSLRDNAWDQIVNVVQGLVSAADTVAAVAGVVALFVGWIPVLGQLAAGIAVVAGIVGLVGNAVLWATSDAEVGDVISSAVGVAAFGLGKAAIGAVGKAAKAGRAVSANRTAAASWGTSARVSAGPRTPSPHSLRSAAVAPWWKRAAEYVPAAGKAVRDAPAEAGRTAGRATTAGGRAAMRRDYELDTHGLGPKQFVQAHALRILGEGPAARELAALHRLPAAVRADRGVVPELGRIKERGSVFGGTVLYSVLDAVKEIGETVQPEPEPADRIRLAPVGVER